jgi:hypothetical protein
MVAMSPTFGDQLNPNPHVDALVTRGGWTGSGEWIPVPYVSSSAAEHLFRHMVISLLQRAGLLDEDRTRLSLSKIVGAKEELEEILRSLGRPAEAAPPSPTLPLP